MNEVLGRYMSVLLLGNGINRCEGLSADWKKVAGNVAEFYGIDPGSVDAMDESMTLGYEMLEHLILEKHPKAKALDILSRIGREVDRISAERKDHSGTLHSALMSLPVETVLTTNYDYSLERALEAGFACSHTTRERTYSLKRFQRAGGKKIYHIHGEAGYPNSISLGFEKYCGALEKLRASIVGSVKNDEKGGSYRLREFLRDELDAPDEWAFKFFTEDIYILGLGLDYAELDLWWLITYRARHLREGRLPVKNRIVFFDLDGGRDRIRNEMLSAFRVDVELCRGADFREKYLAARRKMAEMMG